LKTGFQQTGFYMCARLQRAYDAKAQAVAFSNAQQKHLF
jgi:hypothetical protein